MTGALPAEWQVLAERAGVRATHRGIAEAANVAPSTITRLIFNGRTTPETVTAVANVLRTDARTIYELAGVAVPDEGPWEPPDEAQWLSRRQRAALSELIRSMVAVGDGAEAGTDVADEIRRRRAAAREAHDADTMGEPPEKRRSQG